MHSGRPKSQNRFESTFGDSEKKVGEQKVQFSNFTPRKNRSWSGQTDGPKRPYQPNNRKRNFQKSPRRGRPGEKTLDIQTFIQKASSSAPRKQHTITHTFADFGFCDTLNINLAKQGYVSPTPIQDQSIKPIMANSDVIGLANTGTGKTAAFLLPLINKISQDRSQKVLIIAPTRELALQIDTEFRKFSFGMNIFSAVCIGGAPLYHQQRNLQRKPNVVIGTPGRLKDFAERRLLTYASFNNVVLDEVDRMLDMGFIDIITKILKDGAKDRQLLFFSATLPDSIKKLVHTFLVNPVTVSVQTGHTTENVVQNVIRVKDAVAKFDTLKKLLGRSELEKVLIFSETKRGVESLAIKLYKTGFKVDSIHGDKRQRQREKSLTLFRNN
ncbi:MAG: hypothetical protein COU27_01415, partial [Candidatus Levybacteria bacterium CG10_big_fil_rev_8_21_14_0_10_36_7]